ncbi:MAG: diguanylate cyclase [Aliifodinibius sp.]|nr:diguanylate cyclase [candidate division Zixibacteria bacterium]NIT58757.1 diguanylate cyclase [Fodinibius sp.]NIV13591.1 diguanylate cyclase [Fodinibius sp.]NIY27340.1 diguanylate cyclase [Fodinibius sp.]
MNMTNPTTGLPSGRLIEDELRPLANKNGWTFLQIRIDYYDEFTTKYGPLAGGEVLRFMSMLINEVVNEIGTLYDFVGHLGEESFIIITYCDETDNLIEELEERFNERIPNHYDFSDRMGNGITMPDGSTKPFMQLLIGGASSQGDFADTADIITTVNERMLANLRLQETATN